MQTPAQAAAAAPAQAQGAPGPSTPHVMAVLNATDDHLQAIQHYGHSHDLRAVMGTVRELYELLHEASTGRYDADPVTHSNWLARVDAAVGQAAGDQTGAAS